MELPQTVPYLDWRWDDLVFLVLAGVLLGAALLVVLSRDIIRSGLWLVLCVRSAWPGIYALLGSHVRGGRPGARLHRRHQRAHPLRRDAHAVQGRTGAARLPAPGVGGAGDRRRAGRWPAAHPGRPVHDLAAGRPGAHRRRRARDIAPLLFGDYVFAVRGRRRAAAGGGHRGLYLARREPGHARDRSRARRASRPAATTRADGEGRPREPLAGRLPRPLRAPLRHRRRSGSWPSATPSPCSCPSRSCSTR